MITIEYYIAWLLLLFPTCKKLVLWFQEYYTYIGWILGYSNLLTLHSFDSCVPATSLTIMRMSVNQYCMFFVLFFLLDRQNMSDASRGPAHCCCWICIKRCLKGNNRYICICSALHASIIMHQHALWEGVGVFLCLQKGLYSLHSTARNSQLCRALENLKEKIIHYRHSWNGCIDMQFTL